MTKRQINYPAQRRAPSSPPPQRQWSTGEEVLLSRLWGKEPAPVIAQKLERTTTAIIGKANRMKLPPITREQANAFIRQGYKTWSNSVHDNASEI